MEAKIEKLKRKLERLSQMEQLNLELQQEIINLTKRKCNDNGSCTGDVRSNKNVSDKLKGLATRITPTLSDDEVRYIQHIRTLYLLLLHMSCECIIELSRLWRSFCKTERLIHIFGHFHLFKDNFIQNGLN